MLFSRLRLFKQIIGIVAILFVLTLLDCGRFAGTLSHGGKVSLSKHAKAELLAKH
jgi:hypothetical protein